MDPRVESLLKKMTLEQKASLCSGADFWHLKGIEALGIPSILFTDGPNGLRKQQGTADHVGLGSSVPATCFPSLSSLGSTWDPNLAERIGRALGEECRQEGVSVLLGPGLNMKRSALGGRNFEYLSEDPHLAGQLAAAYVRGVQSQGVGTSPKHFAANNQETRRMTIDTVVDDRALREIYLAAFEEVVQGAHPYTLMTAYNRVNGDHCSENQILLNQILRDEWGFYGVTVTDWGGINERVAGLLAGQDLEMPGTGGANDRKIVAAVREGTLAEGVLDAAVARILGVILRTTASLEEPYQYDPERHQALAREAAAAGSVLLKNGGALPLRAGQTVAIIGRFAREPRYQGSGSSKVNPSRLENAWDALNAALPPGSVIGYADGTDLAHATTLASRADVALVFVGLPEAYESEGFDRTSLALPADHNHLVSAVAGTNPKTVVILSNGAPVLMPWVGEVDAVLESYLGGQAWGPAIADLLTGTTVPSGRLAETFPASLEDEPCRANFPGGTAAVAYAESVYVGYRYYDTANRPVLFPFGHGLSYTTFAWSDLQVDGSLATGFRVTLTVRNEGDFEASEVVQLYVRDVDSTIFRPHKELKAFAKVALAPGEEQRVTLLLDRRAFACWDSGAGAWLVEAGDFELLAGASSADISLTARVTIESAEHPSDWARSLRLRVPEYYKPDARAWADLSASGPFARLLGHELPASDRPRGSPHTRQSTILDIQDRFLGRLLFAVLRTAMRVMFSKKSDPETQKMMEATLLQMPLRNLGMMSQGAVSERTIEALVALLNGRLRRDRGPRA